MQLLIRVLLLGLACCLLFVVHMQIQKILHMDLSKISHVGTRKISDTAYTPETE